MTMLLDPALGPASDQASAAIVGTCGDALQSALGPALARAALADPALLTRIAPWARDLARGLQYRDRHGPGDPPTVELVTRLAGRPVPAILAFRLAETADLAVMLTLRRVTDQALGSGSSTRNPAANNLAAPWLPALHLGYRISLVLELLRLAALGTLPQPSARRRAIRHLVLRRRAGSLWQAANGRQHKASHHHGRHWTWPRTNAGTCCAGHPSAGWCSR